MVRPTRLARWAWISCRISRSSTCCLQHALGGQFDFLFLQALGHRVHLHVQFAFQDQAVIDDGRDAVEQFAVNADVAGLGVETARQREDGKSVQTGANTPMKRLVCGDFTGRIVIIMSLLRILNGHRDSIRVAGRVAADRLFSGRNPHAFRPNLSPSVPIVMQTRYPVPPGAVRMCRRYRRCTNWMLVTATFVLKSSHLLDGLAGPQANRPSGPRCSSGPRSARRRRRHTASGCLPGSGSPG